MAILLLFLDQVADYHGNHQKVLETNQSAYYSEKKTDAKKVPVKNTLIQTEKTRTLWPELVYNYDCDLTSYTDSLRSL